MNRNRRSLSHLPLSQAITAYRKYFLPSLHGYKAFYESFEIPKELDQVIRNASQGIGPDGLMNSHQYRLGYSKCLEAADQLLRFENEIARARTFEEIFVITERVRASIFRLGDLWSYDTALRIGFSKKTYPKEVYNQSGVSKGLRKVSSKVPKGRSVDPLWFPTPFQHLKPYEIENFLCIYGR